MKDNITIAIWLTFIGFVIWCMLTLLPAKCQAGEVFFEWDGVGGGESVYTLRINRILLNTGICLGLNRVDYTVTGLTFITITDLCERFYPLSTDLHSHGLVIKVGAYTKTPAGRWFWRGWSQPAVIDVWADLGKTCHDPTAPVLMYNLPYPKGRP